MSLSLANVLKLLSSWGLHDLIQIFEELQIDEYVLQRLTQSRIDFIFDGRPLGQKIKFEDHLKEYLQQQVLQDLQSSSKIPEDLDILLDLKVQAKDSVDPNHKVILEGEKGNEVIKSVDININLNEDPNNKNHFHEIKQNTDLVDEKEERSKTTRNTRSLSKHRNKENSGLNEGQKLRRLLGTTGTGKSLLSKERIDDHDRGKISEVIIDYLLSISKKISRETFEFWASEICSVFKYEDPNVYYVPAKAPVSKNVRGKLYNTYTRISRFLKNHSLADEVQPEEQKNPHEEIILRKLNKLRTITPDSPQLLQLWTETFESRDRGSSIEAYMNTYPVLKTNVGVDLMLNNFELIVKGKYTPFVVNWPDIAKRIVYFAIENKICEAQTNDSEGIDQEDLALTILPYLFKPLLAASGNSQGKGPKYLPKNKGPAKKNSSWKPSRAEVAQGFIFRVNTLGGLEEALEERKNKLQKYGLTLQPLIILIGSLKKSAIYVYINEHKYRMVNLIGAVDVCFKAFYALDAEYPADCKIIWHLLQKYAFEVKNEPDPTNEELFPSVISICLDLQAVSIQDSTEVSEIEPMEIEDEEDTDDY